MGHQVHGSLCYIGAVAYPIYDDITCYHNAHRCRGYQVLAKANNTKYQIYRYQFIIFIDIRMQDTPLIPPLCAGENQFDQNNISIERYCNGIIIYRALRR